MIKNHITTRSSERVATSASGSCKTANGFNLDVELQDLSSGGCRIEDPRAVMGLGTFVSIIIAGTGPHKAEVAWRQGDRVGVEFLRPLPPRVFKHLAAGEWDAAHTAHETDSTNFPIRRML